jgi:hypothetical protein
MKLRSLIPAISFSLLFAGAPSAFAGVPVPLFSAEFTPDTIGPGSTSTLTFTITNPDSSPVSGLAFSNTLPAGVTIADPAQAFTDCQDATLSAPNGGSTITFSGGRLGGNAFCTISVNVTSSTPGTQMNISGDLTSSAGNSGPATADLVVATDRPGFTKAFSDATLPLGGRTTLTFTIDNSANGSLVFSPSFVDNLPVGLVVADPPNISATVTGTSITAVPGSGVIAGAGGNALIPAGATSTISVDVIATGVGELVNTTESLTVQLATILTCGKASDAIEVVPPGPLAAVTSFTDDPVPPGGTVNAEIVFTNRSRGDAASAIAFTLDLGAALPGLAAIGLPQNDVLGAGSQLSESGGVLSLTGGSLAPGASETVSVALQVPATAAPGAYDFASSSLSADIGGNPSMSAPTTDTLFVSTAPLLTVVYDPNPVVAGGTATLDFTVQNSDPVNPATDIVVTVDFPEILPTAMATPTNGDLGPGSVFQFIPLSNSPFSTPARLTLTGGSLDPGASGSFSITLDVAPDAPNGSFTTTTEAITATVDGASVVGKPASDELLVVAGPDVSMSFADPVQAGDTVQLLFSLNQGQNSPGDATGINFTVDLNAVLPGLAAIDTPQSDVVGSGSLIAGTSVLTLSGGTLAPGETAEFAVTLQVPAGAGAGSFTATSGSINSTVAGRAITGDPISDELDIVVLGFTHEFADPVVPGQTTQLTYTLTNLSATGDITNLVFTHSLSSVISGLVSTSGTLNDVVGTGSQISGTSFLILTGGNLMAGESASFSVDVTIPAAAAVDSFDSATSVATFNFGGGVVIGNSSSDQLDVVEGLVISKQFVPSEVNAGETATLEFTISNLLTSSAMTGITFTDDLDAVIPGLAATDTPQDDVCGAGSQIAGTSLLTLTGGNLGPGESSTFSVSVQVPALVPGGGGTFTNTTSNVTGTAGGVPVTGDPASADLTASNVAFTKSFGGAATPGGTVTLSYTITNLDGTNPVNDLSFTDDLNAVLGRLEAIGLPVADVCGSGSSLSGDSAITLSGGSLPPGGSCTIDVTLQMPPIAASGMYPSTSSELRSGPLPVASPATATLEVESNVGPTLVINQVGAIDENGTVSLTGMILDPNPADTFTLDIDWGDPLSPDNTESHPFPASATGSQPFMLTHQYLDDNPSGTGRDRYTITATLADDSGEEDSGSRSFLVSNVRPTLTLDPVGGVDGGGTATLGGTITDPGTLDTFTLWIDWGDPLSPGNYETVNLGASATGSQTFSLPHTYAEGSQARTDPSSVTVFVLVLDDEGGSGFEFTTLSPPGASPVVVNPAPVPAIEKFEMLADGTSRLTFPAEAGAVYRIESSVDLVKWEVVREAFVAGDEPEQWTDDVNPPGPRRFYRYVRLSP